MAPDDQCKHGIYFREMNTRKRPPLIPPRSKIVLVQFRRILNLQTNDLWEFVGKHSDPFMVKSGSDIFGYLTHEDIAGSVLQNWRLDLQKFTPDGHMCQIVNANPQNPWSVRSEQKVDTTREEKILLAFDDFRRSIALWMFAVGGLQQSKLVSTMAAPIFKDEKRDEMGSFFPVWPMGFLDNEDIPVYFAGVPDIDASQAALYGATYLLEQTWSKTNDAAKAIAKLRGY